MAGCDLHVSEIDTGVEHGGDEGVPQHVWVHARKPYAGLFGEAAQTSGGTVPVHPSATGGQQDGAGSPVVDGSFDGPADGRLEWNQGDLAALAADPEHTVAVLFAEVFDVAAGWLPIRCGPATGP
jgi:hypothetical protein